MVASAAAFLLPFVVVKSLSDPAGYNPSSLTYLIQLSAIPPGGKFLLPFVTLAVFWGPVVLLLILYWKAFCIQVRKLGPGVLCVIVVSLPFGLVGEPRFMTVAWPFMVLAATLMLEEISLKQSFKYGLGFLYILYGQFWFRINAVPWPGGKDEIHYGLWMSWPAYLVQSSLLILSAFWLYRNVAETGCSSMIRPSVAS